MEILEVKDLTVSYGNHIGIQKVNLKINEGEYICIIGENGSGKSTLLKTILGLKKKDSGDIIIHTSFSHISYVAQNNLIDINFPATAREIIMTGLQKHKKLFYNKEDKKQFAKVCNLLEIQNLVNNKIGDLSGGERQRVILARALIRNPKVLILDEPCSGLDINIIKEFYKVLEKLNKEDGITIIMATHDIDEVIELNTRIICIEKTIKYDGNVQDWKGL